MRDNPTQHAETVRLPHRFPLSARDTGDELLAWECQACGVWIREYGPIDRSSCTVDWRARNDGADHG
jgi:hypothetical protein